MKRIFLIVRSFTSLQHYHLGIVNLDALTMIYKKKSGKMKLRMVAPLH
jgi:hypothetical protein